MRWQQLFGTELPIIQAPMAGSQGSALTAAVSNAGALGSLPCAMLSADQLRAQLAALHAATDRPYNLNFFCHTMPAFDGQREAAWRRALRPYYQDLGVDPASLTGTAARLPFDADSAKVLAELRPAVVSFHFGLPATELLERVKGSGATILGCATTVAEARWLEQQGVDAVVAQGVEAGGHRGMFLSSDLGAQQHTHALLAQIVSAVRIPVIAAGGIADAAGVRAAMALGAAGVQAGTAYLLCPEASTSAVHRAALKSKAASRTVVTNLFSGRPARGIVNRLIEELGPMSDLPPAFPWASIALAPLRARAESLGSGDFSPLWCGPHASACRERPAAEVTRALAAGLPARP